jgi:hypothetical protein
LKTPFFESTDVVGPTTADGAGDHEENENEDHQHQRARPSTSDL